MDRATSLYLATLATVDAERLRRLRERAENRAAEYRAAEAQADRALIALRDERDGLAR